jgi:choline-sulfatase
MSKRRYILIIVPAVLFIAGGWYLWRTRLYSGKEFLNGDFIPLIDVFRQDFISNSRFTKPLKSIRSEKLVNGWQKLADFRSVSVWRTFVENPITGPAAPRLYCKRVELQWETHLLTDDIQPDRWNYSNNQILVTVAPGDDPGHLSYFLDYQTDPGLQTMQISGEPLEAGQTYPSKHPESEKLVVYPLRHSLMIRKANPSNSEIVVRRNGEILSASDWKALPELRMLLYRSSVLGVFKMFGTSDAYRQDLYLPGGLVEFKITAKGDLAGNENPRLGIYLDNNKLAQIEITGSEKATYSAVSPVMEGMHRLEVIFENDFYDSKTKADRNVDLAEVFLDYKPAVLIKEPLGAGENKHAIDYPALDFASNTFYWDFFRDRKLNNEWFRSVATGVALQEELRRSLVLTPGDEFTIPVRVANSARLEFGYGFKSSAEEGAGRIVIKMHRAFHLPRILFSEELREKDVWKEKFVDLSRFSGQNLRLSFEALPSNKEANPFLILLSNPTLVSDSSEAKRVKFVFLLSFDALRADHLGTYGYQRPTSPHIDAFARDSVLFENASTAATWTLPSFGSLFTSLYPSFHDAKDISKPLSHSLRTLPELVDKQGYSTAAFIQNPLLHPLYGFAKGFDSYNYHISKDVKERVETSLEWLPLSKSPKKFLFVHLISPHTPYTAPQHHLRRVAGNEADSARIDPSAYARFLNREKCGKLESKDLQDILLMYDAEILQADDLFQSYIRRLKELGWYDDALIILMSDHGEEFLDHGTTFHGQNVFPATTHIPLIIKFPAQHRLHGVRIRNRVHLIDVMPTVLDVLGMQGPSEMQGKSLFSMIHSGAEKVDAERILFTENRDGVLGITHRNYHYVYSEPDARGWSCPPRRMEELYDLKTDPVETRDLFPGHPDLLTLFRRERDSYVSRAEKFRRSKLGTDSSRKVEPERELKEQIRALGYVQ